MQAADRGVRKRPRVSNACKRCRTQKIRCSGTQPCEQCAKRTVTCKFESSTQKILVDASYIARLQEQAARGSAPDGNDSGLRDLRSLEQDRSELPDLTSTEPDSGHLSPNDSDHEISSDLDPAALEDGSLPAFGPSNEQSVQHGNSNMSGSHPDGSMPARSALSNPLVPGNSPSSYIIDRLGQTVYLGTSSNWSFGRRILNMVYERVSGKSLSPASLLFESSTYDLAWNGLRDNVVNDYTSPFTVDHALFLINAVKFHCCHLFHIFDERVFMHQFDLFHEHSNGDTQPSILWFIHYLLILAFGKAFVIRIGKGRKPPGADLFVRAMKMLPDITFLCSADPIQAIEVLICAALYLQCIDMRSAAHNIIGQAMRLAVEHGMHTNMLGHHGAEEVVERARDTWWTVYILDRRMSCYMGTPVSVSDSDITATLPSFSDSARKSLALSHHVQLSKATSIILHTVYSKTGSGDKPFVKSVKDALRTIAEGNDERGSMFPVNLGKSSGGICRLSAYLHLFHHQCLVLATRPLLFFFWQKRLKSHGSLRVTSRGGARSLLRVCVSSAKQTMRILEALQGQGLLESFLPFDREAGISAAMVLCLAASIDESLLRNQSSWLETIYDILDEMTSRGNVIAGLQKSELQQLDDNIKQLQNLPSNGHDAGQTSAPNIATPTSPEAAAAAAIASAEGASDILDGSGDFSSDDGLFNGNQLQLLAETFDFDQFDYWLATGNLSGPIHSL